MEKEIQKYFPQTNDKPAVIAQKAQARKAAELAMQVDLIYWDSRVASHEEYTENMVSDIINSTKPRGGGGTSPSCVSQYLKEKAIVPECVIMLTDGYVGDDWGRDWTAPVLWAIVGGNDCVADNGKTILVKD